MTAGGGPTTLLFHQPSLAPPRQLSLLPAASTQPSTVAPATSSNTSSSVATAAPVVEEGEIRSRIKQLKREVTEAESKTMRREALEGSHKVVALAMTSNGFMFAAKLYGAFVSGSASMFAELVFLEDCSAVLGIGIAGICVSLSKYLALPFIDSLGSIAIGLLLGSLSVFLVRRNIASLVETAMPKDRQKVIESILVQDPVVSSLHDVKTTQIGPDWVRFKAEVLFRGDEVARRYVAKNRGELLRELERLRGLKTEAEIEEWLVLRGAEIITTLANEKNRIEMELK
ncbi:hypothetical protein HK405_002812, partial [Cladochytrium tenue]